MFYFDFKGVLTALLLAAILVYCFNKNLLKASTKLFFSNLDALKSNAPNFKGRWAPWLRYALLGTAGFLLFALLDPHQRNYSFAGNQKKVFSPKAGIGIYLVFDQSGSMNEPVSFLIKEGQDKKASKIELLKKRAEQFVKERPNDLIGLIAFARFPTILSPLTMNHQIILDKLESLQVVKEMAKDGTAIGYALYKTANLIVSTQEYYHKEGEDLNSVIILVTDGLQDPNALDRGHAYRAMELDDAAAFAKKHGIKIFIINLEPRFLEKRFEPNLKQMKRIAEMTGGQFFMANGSNGVGKIFQELEEITKSKIPTEETQEEYEKKALYPYFLGLGLFLALAVFALQNTYFRQVP